MFHQVSSGFQTRETLETTRPQAEWFYCFQAFGNLIKPEARVFEITSPTKKISLNYHLNKVNAWSSEQCAWCAWSYHRSAALWQFLPSCLSVLGEHVASLSKWQSADLDLLKLAKKIKSVWPALFRGNVCILSDKISNVSAILGRKSTARLKVNQNTRSPPLSENLNLEKERAFLFLVV